MEKAVPDAEAFVTGEESSNVKEIVSNLNDVFFLTQQGVFKKIQKEPSSYKPVYDKVATIFLLHVLCEIWWVLHKEQNFTNFCVEVTQNM